MIHEAGGKKRPLTTVGPIDLALADGISTAVQKAVQLSEVSHSQPASQCLPCTMWKVEDGIAACSRCVLIANTAVTGYAVTVEVIN